MKRVLMVAIYAGVIPLLFSCTAILVSRPGHRAVSKYAPINQKTYSNQGVVSYSLNGLASIVQNRREDAYKKMYRTCNGRYRIVQENDLSSGSLAVTQPIGNAYITQAHRMSSRQIVFECVKMDDLIRIGSSARCDTVKNWLKYRLAKKEQGKDIDERVLMKWLIEACACKSKVGCNQARVFLNKYGTSSLPEKHIEAACQLGLAERS